MRRNRLLLPWGLLAGLLIGIAVVQGLNIKAPSLLKKVRNYTTTTSWASTTTTTTTTTETPETTPEEEHEEEVNVTTKSPLSGNPQIDYVFDPNLPRELPRGYNLSEYPFFARVPNDIVYDCDGLLDGFYASITYKCQVYHHCLSGIRYDFLCANYTAFDQRTFICQFVSEVDCVGSAKYYYRNEPLYKGRITTTTTTTTVAPPPTVAARRPAGGSGRKRRPFRRRRPQYDYYDDEDYEDDEYDDDVGGQAPASGGRSQRKRQRRPIAADTAADLDDKPARGGGGGSVYDRPRVLPKIRRPVPLNERDKYEYTPKGDDTDNAGAEKRVQDEDERPADRESKRPVATPPPAAEKTREPEVLPRPRPAKKRPAQAQDDDEYYDDEDYDQPIRTSARKNQDYYAPSAADRDFARRPAMTGGGRPLRRNRPGRRKPAPVEYDDDYEDRRPLRSSTPADDDRRRPDDSRRRPDDDRRRPDDDRRRPDDDRRRPDDDRRRPVQNTRKRVSQQRDEYDRDAEYERPRENKRPQSSRDSYDRPGVSSRDSASYERAPASTSDTSYSRPSTKERPATSGRERESNERVPPSGTDAAFERPLTKERPVAPSRESAYERTTATNVDTVYDRTPSKDGAYERLSGNKKRPQTTRETTNERPRQERPSSRSNSNSDVDRTVAPPTGSGYTTARPLASRGRFTDDDLEDPIAVPKPALVSTTGRSPFRRRGPEEQTSTSAYRVDPRTTPRITEAPPLADDDEYYDDDEEEELEEELPKKPTGSGRTGTGTYRAPPPELPVVKTLKGKEESRGSGDHMEDGVIEEPRVGQSTELRGRIGQSTQEGRVGGGKTNEDRGRVEYVSDERVKVPPTGRERLVPPTGGDGRVRTRQGFPEDEVADERRRGQEGNDRGQSGRVPPPFPREQSRQNPKYRDTEDIIEQPPPSRATQTNYRTKDPVVDEVPASRQGFRPKGTSESTTERFSNFRRKSNQASNIDTSKVLPSREDRIVEIAEDVHIAPSSQGRNRPTGVGMEDVGAPTDVELESEGSRDEANHESIQLDTSKFLSSAESESENTKTSPLSGPSGGAFADKRTPLNPTKPLNQRVPEEVHYKIELPDIDDPEYDVTLNEALHPTRPILLSTEGSRGTKSTKFANYQYRDVSLAPDLLGPGSDKTLLTSASQTHVSKAPFPAYGKDNYRNRHTGTLERTHTHGVTPSTASATSRPTPHYEDHTVFQGEEYDDRPIPTGRGGASAYPTTESSFRASQQPSPIFVSDNRGTSNQQFPGTKVINQYSPLPTTPATGSLRHLEHELSKTIPRGRVPLQPYRSPSQGTIREADFFRGVANPLTLSLGYDIDYDQVAKYRPRRKYVWRDRSRDYYNVY